MSQLRARSAEAKGARRSAILSNARALFDTTPYDSITMSDVAEKAKLAKGTVFIYFATKEELFLALLDELLDEWLTALHQATAADNTRWSSARLADLIVETVAARPALRRLMPLAASVLEHNVPAHRVADSKHRLMKRFFGTGALVEQRLGLNRAADGTQLMVFAHAMIVGLGEGRDAELRTALTVLGNGFHRKAVGQVDR